LSGKKEKTFGGSFVFHYLCKQISHHKKTYTTMKKTKIWSLMILAAMMLLLGCSKDKEDGPVSQPSTNQSSTSGTTVTPPSQEDFYYVKYEVKYSHQQIVEHSVTVNTENGFQTLSLGNAKSRSWDGTYGPLTRIAVV